MGSKKKFKKLVTYLEENKIPYTVIGPIGHWWNFGKYIPRMAMVDMSNISKEQYEELLNLFK